MPVRHTASPALKFLVVVVGLALMALLAHTFFGEGGYADLQRQRKELEDLRKQVNSLEEENRRLNQEIKELRSDPEAIERVARENLRMAKPGETIITLPEEDKKKPDPNGQE